MILINKLKIYLRFVCFQFNRKFIYQTLEIVKLSELENYI